MRATMSEIQTICKLYSIGCDANTIDTLFSASRKLHRMAEKDCNVGLTEKEEAKRQTLFQHCLYIFPADKGVLELVTDPRAGCGLTFFHYGCEWCI